MQRSPIEVGAFSWTRIQGLYDADSGVHWRRCEAAGLQCPQEVFTQLFHAEDPRAVGTEGAGRLGVPMLSDLKTLASIDWGRVTWELAEMSGVALRHMHVDRMFRLALDEARDHAVCYGIVDEREEVEAHWRDTKSWLLPPVAVTGEWMGHEARFELLVGFTRLGNLLGMLDRQKIPEAKTHLVWIGGAS